MRNQRPLIILVFTAALAPSVCAQLGDAKDPPGMVQEEVWWRWDVPPAPVVPPEAALDTFRIAPGFRLEMVAAEPLVEDPVALAWDADGRIWVVEMRGWMPNVDGEGEDAPVGMVAVLEDEDGDGSMDRRTTFLDQLVMPRAVAIVEDGVLVAEPPNLWYCRDLDGDFVCDQKANLTEYGSPENVEHTDNGLVRAVDNWLYSAKSDRRIQFRNGQVKSERTLFRGQWGITQDDFGRIFSNTNSRFLIGDAFFPEYLLRNPNLAEMAGVNVEIAPRDQYEVFPVRVNPGINRGYGMRSLREDGRLRRPEAASGPTIYRGDQFPAEYYGNAFVPLPAGNAIACFELAETKLKFRTAHRLFPDEEWGRREFLASTDERFRPVNLYTGPDGCLYVVDLYRGILEHRIYMTTYLRKQIIERGLDKPTGLGRIYRVVYDDGAPSSTRPGLAGASNDELMKHLAHPNGWWRDTAQRLLVERSDPGVVEPLRQSITNTRDARAAIHALWTLEGMDALDTETVQSSLRFGNPNVRIAALRVADSLDQQHRHTLMEAVTPRLWDSNRAVRVQAAFTLGGHTNDDEVFDVFADACADFGDDEYFRQAVVSGLRQRELRFLTYLLTREDWRDGWKPKRLVLTDMASTIFNSGDGERIESLIALITTERLPVRQRAIADGIIVVANRPGFLWPELPAEPSALLALVNDASSLSWSREVANAITWKGDDKFAYLENLPGLSPREQQYVYRGKELYETYCAQCHDRSGKGIPNTAPTLRGTDWVLGPPDALIKMLIHGMDGPVTVAGEEWDQPMPSHGENPDFNNEGIGAVLSYVRRSWGNAAGLVQPDVVHHVRASVSDRSKPWSADEIRTRADVGKESP